MHCQFGWRRELLGFVQGRLHSYGRLPWYRCRRIAVPPRNKRPRWSMSGCPVAAIKFFERCVVGTWPRSFILLPYLIRNEAAFCSIADIMCWEMSSQFTTVYEGIMLNPPSFCLVSQIKAPTSSFPRNFQPSCMT